MVARSSSPRAWCVSQTVVSTGYTARAQFASLHRRKQRWGVAVCHVRAGKTVACINDLIDASIRCQLPNPRFAYVAPFFSQAKDVAWGYLKQYTAAIPGVQVNESELRVDLPGGRRIRLYGADNYERLSGIYLDGVVLDEYGDMDPRAWKEVIRARLSDRNGWAVFIGTPKGVNHFADLWQAAKSNPEWFTLQLKASETKLLHEEELASARQVMTDEDYAAQYECSFEASVVGSYWGKQMQIADQEKRICHVPHQPEVGVDTWWDLGVDNMAIWCTQNVGREVHVIDYLEGEGAGLPAYAKALKDKPYVYNSHNVPHDADAREIGSGKTRSETAKALGLTFTRVPDIDVGDGIDAARSFLSRCWFDRVRTERGRSALVSYRKVWDEKRKTFHNQPHKDWATHGADAFRYLAVGHKFSAPKRAQAQPRVLQEAGSASTAWLGS